MKVIQLKKSDGSVFVISGHAPTLSDLAAVLVGVKPVIYLSASQDQKAYIKEISRFFSLLYEEAGREKDSQGRGKPTQAVFLAKNAQSLKTAVSLWRTGALNTRKWGKLLGYPECCVKFFNQWERRHHPERLKDSDIVPAIYKNTPQKETPPFYLNNLFNHQSRHVIHFVARERRLGMRMGRLNPQMVLPLSMMNVISWHPCRYNCAPSVKKAEKIWMFLEQIMPEAAAEIKKTLSLSFFYLGKREFAALNGRPSKNEIKYSGLKPPESLLKSADKRMLKIGDRLVLSGGAVNVFKGGDLVGRIRDSRRKPILLSFSAGAGS